MSVVNSSHFGSRSALPGLPLLERIATFYTHPLPQVRRALMDTMLQCIELSCNDELSAALCFRPPALPPDGLTDRTLAWLCSDRSARHTGVDRVWTVQLIAHSLRSGAAVVCY
jgi:hypothetical protein